MAQLNAQQFAERVGVSKQRISAAIKSGMLAESVTVGPPGRGGHRSYTIDEEKGVAEWNAKRDISRIPDPVRADASRSMAQSLKGEGGSEETVSWQKSKAISAAFDAQMKRLDFLERAGKLVAVKEVKDAQFHLGRMLRDAILNIPGRVAAELAVMSDAHAIEVYLVEHLATALEDMGRSHE